MTGIESFAEKQLENEELSNAVKELPKIKECSNDFETSGRLIIEPPDVSYIEHASRSALIEQCSFQATERTSTEDLNKAEVAETKSKSLTEEQKEYLRENTSLSGTAIENICGVDTEDRYHLKCRNEELAGKRHEATGIKYVEKTITVDSVELVGVFPEFKAAFECKIPDEIQKNGDREIFRYCTEQLRDYLEAHLEEKALFNEQQLEQITNGEPYIKGYTWHHNEVPGKMQLVETKVHAMSGHTGGNSIWCGGIR